MALMRAAQQEADLLVHRVAVEQRAKPHHDPRLFVYI